MRVSNVLDLETTLPIAPDMQVGIVHQVNVCRNMVEICKTDDSSTDASHTARCCNSRNIDANRRALTASKYDDGPGNMKVQLLNNCGSMNKCNDNCDVHLILSQNRRRMKNVMKVKNAKCGRKGKINNMSQPRSKAECDKSKVALKMCLRQLKKMSVRKPKTRKSNANMAISESPQNKAGNNNWMLDNNEESDTVCTLVVPTFHNKSRASSFSTLIEPKCNSKTVFRASSSNDSGYLSNALARSPNLLHVNKCDSRAGIFRSKYIHSAADNSKCTSVPRCRLCRHCGNESLDRDWLICKSCSGRSKQDGFRNGALSELKAYAQSFANSVKKLLLSPGFEKCDENEPNSKKNDQNHVQNLEQTDNASTKYGPKVALHRYMTEINMTSLQKTSAKSPLNKSVSYDGAGNDENEKRSLLNWLSLDNAEISGFFSKLTQCGNISNYDSSPGNDGDAGPRTGKMDETKVKISSKQLTRVKRVRTDGDIRSNLLQQSDANKKTGKDEHRTRFEYQRNRSRTFHEVDVDIEDLCEHPSQHVDETNYKDSFNVSKQNITQEGSPVDPPCNFDIKKLNDSKSRKAVFIRSATTPYKNYLNTKDVSGGDKVDATMKINKSNVKPAVRTNKASTLRKENSLSDKRKVQVCVETIGDCLTDSTPANCTFTFSSRRCTSYDGCQQLQHKRDRLHRSISWSMVEGDDEGSRHRRAAASNNISVKKQKEKEEFSLKEEQPSLKLKERRHKDSHAKNNADVDSFQREFTVESMKLPSRENFHEKPSLMNPETIALANNNYHVEQAQPKNIPYFSNRKYYDNDIKRVLSPCIEEDTTNIYSAINFNQESDYFSAETATNNNQFLPSFDSDHGINTLDMISSFKKQDTDGIYHDQITTYVSNSIASPWYSQTQEIVNRQVTIPRRERSLDSKSGISFHSLIKTRSSHSDEAIIKYYDFWEHSTSRKPTMYSETDVDTGMIYHLSKRQGTRSYVPPYHEFISKDIYTMSGDISTSTSSDSTISSKSDLSECAYTGGFFKEDPFYNNSDQSGESSSCIYFESDGQSKCVQSEIDIYTGNIFNGNQNVLSIGEQIGLCRKDVSANNCVRSFVGRTRRHFTCSSCNDSQIAKNVRLSREKISQHVLGCGGDHLCNVSNNSNNWYDIEDVESLANQGSVDTQSVEPLYTDYNPGMRPAEFHVKTIEKSEPSFDFFKYENSSKPNSPKLLESCEIDRSSGDNIWYSGLLRTLSNESLHKQSKRIEQSPDMSMLTWQYSDDYYKSSVCPKAANSNRYVVGEHGKVMRNSNNNHFEDLYTGPYGAQNIQPLIQEQPPPPPIRREPPQENWYVNEPPVLQMSPSFYEKKYGFVHSSSDHERKAKLISESATQDPRFQSNSRVQEATAYSESKTYLTENILRKYDQIYGTPIEVTNEMPPMRVMLAETITQKNKEINNMTSYGTNLSSTRGFYSIDDDDTYSFEPKIVKVKEVPQAPVVPEIKTVGGIVCRDNVVNKEDYAEDINRDLEPGGWTPFSFRFADEAKYSTESSSISDVLKSEGHKHPEDTSYAHNRLYDNSGARNKWREMAAKRDNDIVKTKEATRHRAHQGGDTGKHDYLKNRILPDVIPDRARGRRTNSTSRKSVTIPDAMSMHKGSVCVSPASNRRF